MRIDELPFSFATAFSRSVFEHATLSAEPREAQGGSMVYRGDDGTYLFRHDGKDFEKTTEAEIETAGLQDYAYAVLTIRSSDALEGIYEDVAATSLGLLGYLLSGLAYETRDRANATAT